ncbi:transposase [Enterococcus rivorum]|uniref:Transposase n=1 Tax=Enterococcus rivorum TaxID=762845 RepID=A0A1E5KWD3_9ENTE|nr:transposase [Enterococcus rivorum]
MKDQLVIDAFLQACGQEKPKARLIIHTDQGSQYTSSNFQAEL